MYVYIYNVWHKINQENFIGYVVLGLTGTYTIIGKHAVGKMFVL